MQHPFEKSELSLPFATKRSLRGDPHIRCHSGTSTAFDRPRRSVAVDLIGVGCEP